MSQYKIVYDLAFEYLKKISPVKPDELNEYFQTNTGFVAKDMAEVFDRMLFSAQNSQSMPKVIDYRGKREKIKQILFDFNYAEVLNSYKSEQELYDKFQNEFKINNASSKYNLWLRWSKSIIDISRFLLKFKDVEDFKRFIDKFEYNQFTKAALPMIISKEIRGIGFALACDFMKELGYSDYPKPDVHLIDVFSELNLSKNDQWDNYKSIIEMAEVVGETPYKIDKVFWLISSGYFYLQEKRIGQHKKEFIEIAKEKLKSLT